MTFHSGWNQEIQKILHDQGNFIALIFSEDRQWAVGLVTCSRKRWPFILGWNRKSRKSYIICFCPIWKVVSSLPTDLIFLVQTSGWWRGRGRRETPSWWPRPHAGCISGRGEGARGQSPSLDTCSHWPPSSARWPPGTRGSQRGWWAGWCPAQSPREDSHSSCGTFHPRNIRTGRKAGTSAYTLTCIPCN